MHLMLLVLVLLGIDVIIFVTWFGADRLQIKYWKGFIQVNLSAIMK